MPQKIVDNYKERRSVKTFHGGGKKRVTDAHTDRRIYSEARENPSKSARELKETLDLTASVWKIKRSWITQLYSKETTIHI